MRNIDSFRELEPEELANVFTRYNMCPSAFGSKRRGKYKTCPYPNHTESECRTCWIEWFASKHKKK